MKHGESMAQRAYFEWARLHPIAKRAFAVPNGGARSKPTAAILKAEGVLAGVSDVMLPFPAGGAHGLWIEFKHGANTLTHEQRQWLDDMLGLGYQCCVAYDAELAIKHTVRYMRGDLPLGAGLVSLKRAAKP